MLEIKKKIGDRRIGTLQTKSGDIHTPFFMPIATKGTVKNITPEELKEVGAEIVLGNTYHLWLRPGDDLIAKAGDLHRFMNWDGPILTDSGGFQVFSLGARAKDKYGKSGVTLSDDGVEFIDPIDGKKHFMTPEKSIDIQLNLGSDIIMVLDECTSFPCERAEVRRAVDRTTAWAKRCYDHFHRRVRENEAKYSQGRPLLFCIVQGSVYEDLRRESVRQLGQIGAWDGYALGGMVPIDNLEEVARWLVGLLPEETPRYIMGIGRPEEIVSAVRLGFDMFDCVIPTREGRHGRLFLRKPGIESLEEYGIANPDFYQTINIINEKFKEDFTPVDELCDCMLCKNYTKAYLRHLFMVKEPLALRLAAIHNLKFYLDLMNRLKSD